MLQRGEPQRQSPTPGKRLMPEDLRNALPRLGGLSNRYSFFWLEGSKQQFFAPLHRTDSSLAKHKGRTVQSLCVRLIHTSIMQRRTIFPSRQ